MPKYKMRIVNNELVIDEPIKQDKKISGHNFVDLIGLNPYAKKGDTLLQMFGFIKKEVDPKYLKRGNFAEKIVKYVYERDGHECTTYDPKEIGYDCFKDNDKYSGIIDIELLKEQTLIEVKSKSEKDYEKIEKEPPIWEIGQGLYYGFLRKYKVITLEWIFFDEQTEREIYDDLKPSSLKNLKRISKKYQVNEDKMLTKVYLAYSIVDNFKKTKTIPLKDISDEVLKELGFDRNDMFLDLPF